MHYKLLNHGSETSQLLILIEMAVKKNHAIISFNKASQFYLYIFLFRIANSKI